MANVNITYNDPTNALSAYPLLAPTILAAVAYVEQYVVFKGTLDIQINVETTATGRFAGNGSVAYRSTVDGIAIWEPSMLAESRSGTDPYPLSPDFTIYIDPTSSYLAGMWWDPAIGTSLAANPPNNQTDAFSVIVHELLHGMGVTGWRSVATGALSTTYESVWDSLVLVNGQAAVFAGAATQALLGVPAEVMVGGTQGLFHLGASPGVANSSMAWIEGDNLNGYHYFLGERYTIGRLDLAILQDLGWTLKPTTLTDVVNRWDDHATALYMVGWDTDEQLVGDVLADRIEGRGGNDLLTGLDGNDTLIGGAGDDALRGGAGMDTAVWSGTAANYTLVIAGDHVELQARSGAEGKDTLTDVERLHFSDRDVIVEAKAHASYSTLPDSLYHFFIVAFDAAPGVTYMDQLAEAYQYGLSVKQIVGIYMTKPQFTDVYPESLSHAQLADRLVSHIVKNSASAEVKSQAVGDITAALDIGWSRGDVIYTVFGNLAGKPLNDATWGDTARQFQNEIAVAKYYTEVMNQSTTDLPTLRTVLQAVDAHTDVSTGQTLVQLIGLGLMGGAGG